MYQTDYLNVEMPSLHKSYSDGTRWNYFRSLRGK